MRLTEIVEIYVEEIGRRLVQAIVRRCIRGSALTRNTVRLGAFRLTLGRLKLGRFNINRVLKTTLGRNREHVRIDCAEDLIHNIVVVGSLLLRSAVLNLNRSNTRIKVARDFALIILS